MQFKSYIWPHNPRLYTIDYQRSMALHKVPFGRYCLQNLGLSRRVMKGEGEFIGKSAYSEFKKLAALFYEETPGLLIHPVWQSTKAYFVELSLKQEPRKDYVRYSFTFWETFDGYGGSLRKVSNPANPTAQVSPSKTNGKERFHTVVSGETLWNIASHYALSLPQLLSLNPNIKNPNRIYPGERVRVV